MTAQEHDPVIGVIPFGDITFQIRRSQLDERSKQIYDEIITSKIIRSVSVVSGEQKQ